MANAEFDVELFEKKLQSLKDSQESIQSLSSWCLERRQHHKKIVSTWLQVLKKVKVEHRLTLFYLANDVIQYSKRKNFEFVESWGTTLQRATTMVREEKVKHRILRIFKIWEQRQIYDEEFLADLSGLLSAAPKKKQEPQVASEPDEFQAALLISTMRSCATLEQMTDARLRDLRDSKVDLDNIEEICTTLKDRRHVEDVERDVDTAAKSVENYVKALEAEIRERSQVLELLEQADQFYETQRSEVKIVANAYKNFGSRVKNLKKKLDELIPMLTSPIPSPDINAPSPSPDSDIELPGEENITVNQSAIIEVAPPVLYGSYPQEYEQSSTSDQAHGNDFTPNFSSFMGGNVDFDMRNLFNDRSTTPISTNPQYDSIEAKPIEVINSRPIEAATTEDYNISSFLNNVMPAERSVPNIGGIPGLGLDAVDNVSLHSPQRADYGHSPSIGQLPGTPIGSRALPNQAMSTNAQMSHSTPIPMRNLNIDAHTPTPYANHNSQGNVSFDNTSVTPLPPPPLPPPIFLDDDGACYNKLPPKFPTWAPTNEMVESNKWNDKGKNNMNQTWSGEDKMKNQWSDMDNSQWDQRNNTTWNTRIRNKNLTETPESPPLYEKSGFTDPAVEYNDSQEQDPLLGSVGDVDHRILQVPLPLDSLPHRVAKTADVDHRNLISLTGSPANNSSTNDSTSIHMNDTLWTNTDQDYRRHSQPGDNVESVDMDMSLSDEEAENKQKGRGVLVDVRHQDHRDMPERDRDRRMDMDMDMRMIPLPGGIPPSGPASSHSLSLPLPPPPMPPFQSDFHQSQNSIFPLDGPNNFRLNDANKYHQNQVPPFQQQTFGPQQQQNFAANQSSSYPDYSFHDNKHERYTDSMDDKRGRFQHRLDHSFRDRESYQWSDRQNRGRGGARGRGRYMDDHQNNQKQWSSPNNRRGRGPAANRHIVNDDQSNNLNSLNVTTTDDVTSKQSTNLNSLSHDGPSDSGAVNPEVDFTVDPENVPNNVETQEVSQSNANDLANSISLSNEQPKQLSEELEAMMKQQDELTATTTTTTITTTTTESDQTQNGAPLLSTAPTQLESPIPQQHNFRQRLPVWRGSPNMRSRAGGFRGSPRGMWLDNRGGPRGPMNSPGFSPRGPSPRANRASFRGNRGGRW